MKRSLLLLLEFVVLTVPLAWAWLVWGRDLYLQLLFTLLDPVTQALGVPPARRGALGAALRFASHVPFLVLMAITPAITLRRRILGWATGAAILVVSHLCLLLLTDTAFAARRPVMETILPLVLLVEGLPFLLWVVLARRFLASVVPGFREPGGPPAAP